MSQPVYPDKKDFLALAATKMPFGKYKNVRLVDLPEPYLVCFCKADSTCHRYLLADYLTGLGAEYMGERCS